MLAALQKGISLNSVFNGPPEVTVDGVTIHNSSPGESCYGCTLIKAFAQSINTIFVPLAQQVGPQNVVNAAYVAGIPKFRKLSAVPDISLGPDSVSPVDLADAYATIAAQGIHADPVPRVVGHHRHGGQRIYKATPHLTSGVPVDVTSDETYAMTKVLAPGGTAYGRALTGRPSAGKTGTTDNNTNAWFTGFTPQLCTSVWIGNVDSAQTVEGAGIGEVFGGTLPAEIWQQSMNGALAGCTGAAVPAGGELGDAAGQRHAEHVTLGDSYGDGDGHGDPDRDADDHPHDVTPTTPPPTITPTIPRPIPQHRPRARPRRARPMPGLAGQAERTRRRASR